MTFEEIKKLIKQFDDSSLTELEYTVEGESIVLKKSDDSHPVYTQPIMVHPQSVPMAGAPAIPGSVPVIAENGQPGAPAAGGAAAAEGHADSPGTEDTPPGVEVITSPIVGTFYRSPSPDSPPYCQDGDVVEKGNTICILEAMKVMNELEAEFEMEIVRFKVNNGDMVEYGTPICEVRRV